MTNTNESRLITGLESLYTLYLLMIYMYSESLPNVIMGFNGYNLQYDRTEMHEIKSCSVTSYSQYK